MEKNICDECQRNNDAKYPILAGSFLGFFVLWILFSIIGDDFMRWLDRKDKLASWVQAIGSILALIIAMAVPYYQQEKGKSERSKERNMVSRDNYLFIKREVDFYINVCISNINMFNQQNITNEWKGHKNSYFMNSIIQNQIPDLMHILSAREVLGGYFDEFMSLIQKINHQHKIILQTNNSIEILKRDFNVEYVEMMIDSVLKNYFNNILQSANDYRALTEKIEIKLKNQHS